MTNSLIVTIFASSVIVSLVSIVLYLMKPLSNRYCSKRLQYYMWLILAIRLLIPFGVSIPIPNDLLAQSVSENEVISNYEINDLNASYKAKIEGISGMTTSNITTNHKNIPTHVELSEMPNITLTPYDICLGIIFGMAVILLIGRVTVYLKFKRLLMNSAKPIEDDIMLDQFDFIKEKMGIKRAVKLLVHDAIGSPMLIGILRPTIVLPSVFVSSSAQVNIDYVFLHELTHFKNRDIIYKWLLQCVMCFHWFNPLTYLICSECHKLCELSCDEAITQKLSYNEKRAYGDTLLQSMELVDAYAYPAIALTLAENAKLIKERLEELMKKRRKSRCSTILSVILASVITFPTLITDVYAAPPMESNTVIVNDYLDSTAIPVLLNTIAKTKDTDSKIFNIDVKNPETTTNGLVFINLGKRTLTQGQRLLADINWEGSGALMFVYTKEKLDATSAKKLIENGMLELDINNKTNLRINLTVNSSPRLNFAVNKVGVISWINDILDSGEHNFYIVGLANTGIKNISGVINPNHNLIAGDKLTHITKWGGSIGEVEKNGTIDVNADDYIGDKINYEFTAKKGDSKTITLNSYLVGSYEVVFTTADRTVIKAIPAFSKTQDVTLDNLPEGVISMRLLGSNVSGSLIVKPQATTLAHNTITKDETSYSTQTAATPQRGVISEGSVAANLTGFGITFVASKGDKVTIKLIEDLEGMGLDKDKIKLKVIIGDNHANTRREINLSNKDREFSFVALQSATHWVKIVNDNMQSVNYKFEILTPHLYSSEVNSQQTKPNTQKSNNILYEGGIAANLMGPASGNQLTVSKGDRITISLTEDLSGWRLAKDFIKVTIMIDDQSVVLSNTDREKAIIANNAGTFTVKIKNNNMQLVNYKFNLTIDK